MKKRNVTILASSALLAACLVAAPATLKANADGSFFQMVNGATIRTTPDNPGIRFSATMSSDKYSEVVAENSGKSFGMLVVPTDYLDGATDTDNDGVPNYVEHVSENHTAVVGGETVVLGLMENLNAYSYDIDDNGTNDICISGAITGMQFKNMNRDFTGIAFIKTVGETSTTYEYATAPTGEYASRNITYVASRAYADSDNAQFYDTLKGFVNDGVKQAAGLTADAETPEVTVSLNKTEVPYLSDTEVAVQYEANSKVLDIDLYSTITKADEDNSVAEFANNVISPVDFSASPETVATKVSAGVNLEVSVPVFAYEQSSNVAIVCDYESSVSLEKFAVNSIETFDLGAYLSETVALKEGVSWGAFTYSSNAILHSIIHENGVITPSDGEMKATNANQETVSVIGNYLVGQNVHNVSIDVVGKNGNSLDLISTSIAFFNCDTVLANGLLYVDTDNLNGSAYEIVTANGGYKWNGWQSPSVVVESGLPFKWGITEGTFIKIPRHFDYHVYMNLASSYDNAVLMWLHNKGYKLEIAIACDMDETYFTSTSNVPVGTGWYAGGGANLRTDGGWQSMQVSLEEFTAVTIGVVPTETSYHLQLSAAYDKVGSCTGDTSTTKDGAIIGQMYMQIPKFVLATAE